MNHSAIEADYLIVGSGAARHLLCRRRPERTFRAVRAGRAARCIARGRASPISTCSTSRSPVWPRPNLSAMWLPPSAWFTSTVRVTGQTGRPLAAFNPARAFSAAWSNPRCPAVLAERAGHCCLCGRVPAHGISWRPELVPQHHTVVGAARALAWRRDPPAVDVHRRRARQRAQVSGLAITNRKVQQDAARPARLPYPARCRALGAARTRGGCQCAVADFPGRPVNSLIDLNAPEPNGRDFFNDRRL